MDPCPGEVVLDTNVFVAAGFNPGSHSARLIEAVRAGRVPDPADRKFAALAEAARAPLVTSDAGLLNARARITVRVLKPSEFAREWVRR